MAVTLEQQPYQYLNLSGNPIMWVFSSDETSQPNFTYYIELYINGVLDSTHEKVLESGTLGKFDASVYAENNTQTQSLPANIGGDNPLNSALIYIKVFERYGTTPALQASASSTEVLAIKAKKEFDDWLYFRTVASRYARSTGIGASSLLLTEDPDIKIREDETLYFTTVFRSAGVSYNFNVIYKDASGVTLDSFSQNNNASGMVDSVALTYDYLESSYSGPGTFDDVSYLLVYSGVSGDASRITIDRSCRLEQYQVHFLTQIGGISSFTFNRLGTETMITKAKSLQTNRGGFDGTSFDWDGLNSNKGNFQITGKKKLKLTSDWIDEDKKQYLLDNLFLSPWVVMETPQGLRRIASIGQALKFNKKPFETLFNVEMTIDKGTHTSMTV